MTELLHLTERGLWDAAREKGTYEISTRGRTLQEVGFLHASLRHQLPGVARMLYGERADSRESPGDGGGGPGELVVLVIDSELLSVPVVYEPPAPGLESFPHIYGPLPVEAVVRVEPWSPGGGAP